MDLKQLECFVRVVELGSITRAAITLNLSQPVVSRHIRQLEIDLKQHLLERNGRGVVPTASGKRLFVHGQGILRQVQLAQQDLGEHAGDLTGRVNIGMPPNIGKLFAVTLTQSFMQAFPNAMLSITEALTVSMHEWLLLGRLDAALLYNPPPSKQVHSEALWAEDLFLIGLATEQHPLPDTIALRDLPQYPLILPSQPNTIRHLIDQQCASLNLEPQVVLEIDAIESLLDLAAAGVGYVILTRDTVRRRSQRPGLQAARLVHPTLTTHLCITTSSQRLQSRLTEATVALVREHILAGVLNPHSGVRRPADGGM